MKKRCYNKNANNYENYGGRGIKMCDEWKNNFQAFYTWAINNGYKKELSLDKIDNNGKTKAIIILDGSRIICKNSFLIKAVNIFIFHSP